MATDKLSLYLQINGAETAQKQFKELGKNGMYALNGVTASAKPVNSALVAMNSTIGKVSKTMGCFVGVLGAYAGWQGLSGSFESIKQTNTDFQKLSASLKVTEQSATKADEVLSNLTTQAITATTLATKNMALTLAASSAITSKAATAQILAMNSIKVAANGLGKAMSLVGGPLGLIAIAGFSIYEYAKKSDSTAEASSKYAAELKQVEKNATSLTTATKKLNEETSKQTKLALLNDIDEAKKSIKVITTPDLIETQVKLTE